MSNDITSYKCPCCGAELKFSAASQKMTCEYCGTELDVKAVEEFSRAASETPVNSCEWNNYTETEMQTDANACAYTCDSCGAEIVGDKTLAASSCPYCGSPVVMNDKFAGMLKPDYIIPFKVDKEKATEEFKRLCSGKKLLPSDFLSKAGIESIQGVYVPYWLFDCDTSADIRYRGEKISTWSDGDYDVTETSHYLVIRCGNIGFDHVPVDGSTKMDHNYTEAIEPFNTKSAESFSSVYLSGYLADRYDRSAEECKPRANERIKQTVEDEFRKTAPNYTILKPEQTSISFKDGRISYSLMPMWLMTTVYNGEKYSFAMNGETGKFVGKLPVSKGKMFGWFLGITAVSAAVITLLLTILGI
ncbi:MAG: hypothetical protein ACI4KF_11890 [Huintestinicola sp.]